MSKTMHNQLHYYSRYKLLDVPCRCQTYYIATHKDLGIFYLLTWLGNVIMNVITSKTFTIHIIYPLYNTRSTTQYWQTPTQLHSHPITSCMQRVFILTDSPIVRIAIWNALATSQLPVNLSLSMQLSHQDQAISIFMESFLTNFQSDNPCMHV